MGVSVAEVSATGLPVAASVEVEVTSATREALARGVDLLVDMMSIRTSCQVKDPPASQVDCVMILMIMIFRSSA